MRRTLLAGAAIGLVAVLGIGAPAQATPAAHAKTALVRVLHGVPDLPVDVYVGGQKLIDDFEPGTLSEKFKVPKGRYTVSVTAADAPDAENPLLTRDYLFIGGRNYTVAAHLAEDGAPRLTKYRNSTKSLTPSKGRITVRHTAAAPAVDILVNGEVAMSHLRNPKESLAKLPVGTYSVAVALAGTTEPVIGPVDVTIKANRNIIVYAAGSAEAGNLSVGVQSVNLK